MKKLYIYPLILLAITAIASSCTKGDEGAIVPQGNELVVKAELISSSAWASRAAGDGVIYGNSSQTDDGEYIITAQKQEWKGDTTSISNAPATRGTPISTASGIANMRINVFNTGTTNWTTSSTLTQALTATNSGGGFSVSPAYNWATNATAKTTLFAFSPTPTGSNGVTDVAPNKITYVVPTTVGNQPDLCTATPGVDIVNRYGTEQSRIFYMNHQLTAVGFSMLGWNLKITSITLSDIVVQGTLTMNSNGTSSWATSTRGSRSVGVTQNSYQHTINNSYANITTSDGYLMMIPQALSAAATVTINYSSTGTGSASGTTTAKLNELGVTWNAGDKITYNIRLKTAPAVTSGDLIIDNPKAGYTTTNAMSMVMDNRDNLTFTWNASWLKIHKGAPKAGDTSGGALSGWTTGTGGPWSNIYFFATNDNTSTIAERTASVTVTGTRSGSKTFNVKQAMTPPPPATEEIAGTLWLTSNLTGQPSSNEDHTVTNDPADLGMFFKWGSTYIYQRATSRTDGEGWSGQSGSSYQPNLTRSETYDYDLTKMVGSNYMGDPCQKLGAEYKTPTSKQIKDLIGAGYSNLTTYKGVVGRFFGTGAGFCTNNSIAMNSIFLPAAGCRFYNDGSLDSEMTYGYYTSSSAGEYRLTNLLEVSGNSYVGIIVLNRGTGCSVRCIKVK